MRKIIVFMILLGLAASGAAAQKRRAPVKPAAAVRTPASVAGRVSDAECKALAVALAGENWTRAAALAAAQLQILKTDNAQKQLAQLRYIYLYSLAGRILAFNARNNAAEAQKTWLELDRAMETMIGREFVLPARPFAESCEKRLNYICQVKDTPNAFRTTATSKEGNAIHSFDYVVFERAPDVAAFREKEIFLGGTLQKADYNEDPAKPWAIRLFFNRGFVAAGAGRERAAGQ
jgi:hypothetical protein